MPRVSGSDAHGHVGRTVLIGKRLDDLLPGHSLLLKDFAVDEFAIRVQYEIRPPVVQTPTPLNATWLLAAIDDLGNEYTSAGGAFGLSADETFTDGVHSLQPLAARGATFIDLRFIGPNDLDEEATPEHVIRVQLT
jgi:hypothetical protein